VKKPSDIAFNHPKVIKLSNFRGNNMEMRLVKFLLEKIPGFKSFDNNFYSRI